MRNSVRPDDVWQFFPLVKGNRPVEALQAHSEKFIFYRKPTTTDLIIPKDSCHPFKQKTAAIQYHHDRLLPYRLSPECREKEKGTIKQILANNKYDPNHDIPELKQKKSRTSTHIHKRKNGQGSRMSGRKPVTLLKYLKTRT